MQVPHATTPKFSSNIYLVPRQTFDQLVARQMPKTEIPRDTEEFTDFFSGKYKHFAWYKKPSHGIDQRVKLKNKGYTTYAYNCNIGALTGGGKLSLMHLYPVEADKLDIGAIEQALEIDAQDLFHRCPNGPQGLIAGGRGYWQQKGDSEKVAPANYQNSKALREALMQGMKKAGIRTDAISILWGRKNRGMNGATATLYDGKRDAWYVNVGFHNTDKPDALSEAALQDTFRRVRISDQDRLITPEDNPADYQKHMASVLGKAACKATPA